jgi:hypothetical protein
MISCNPFETKCIEFEDARPSVVLRDKKAKSEYRAENQARKNLICLRVDGCLISTTQVKKCDYLLLNCSDKVAHYIELKGADIKTAIEQLANSARLTIGQLQGTGFTIATAKLVLTRTPKIVPAKEWLGLRNLMKGYNGDAYRRNTPFKDSL